MDAFVRAATLKHYIEVAQTLALNPGEMLRDVGLLPTLLDDPESLLPLDAALRLLENSAERSACPTFGLRMAQARRMSDIGVVSLLLSHQRTLRDMLLTSIEYRHLLNRTLAMNLETTGNMVLIREEIMAEAGMPKRQATELAIGILHRTCKSVMGNQWNPQSVHFSHEAPASAHEHTRFFRCRVVFDAEFDGIFCSKEDIDQLNPQADLAMAGYARQFMDSMAGANERSVIFDVRKAIYLLMPVGRATIHQVAYAQAVSVRTLQRELDEEGLTFSALLNAVRRELALRYMENRNYSLQRVGMMLGYTVPTSFTRWFCAEFGCAPREWRNRNKQLASDSFT
ncbi:AraC family transcriptional regulator [Pseudomonas putida]|jgi:AraC-like DNA-binding protein|uniref:AraC family transcriptional regulator n=1 Tax=Pseudomonas neuropathica TaxID=2730425 RepID=A0ACC7ML99_9PSED|nr:AraC family transcriptional regulator [Pseudomonas putida]MDD2101463.1 AraC family transcriptional regulator [Pseudomonas putida]